jgi:enoyl-CoA hydratase/carnithine racemase
MVPEIALTRDAGIFTIRINRPEKKNALTNAMYTALGDALLEAAQDKAVRVVMFAGCTDIFCSGNDLKDFLSAKGSLKDLPVGRFIEILGNYEKPVVAAVNGAAIGIGTTLLLHCDLVYAGEKARFQMPFASLGLCPEFASSYVLPRLIGHVKAAELLMLGEVLNAEKALDMGLINEVLSPEAVEERAYAQAARLAKQAPQALRVTKRLMRQSYGVNMQKAIDVEMTHFSELLKGEEMQEAIDAFMQKRAADFSRFE